MRVLTHARIGFVFMLRWLHINLFKWRLWLYFHWMSMEETTGLLSKKERKSNIDVKRRKKKLSMWLPFEESAKDVIISHISLYRTDFPFTLGKKRLVEIKKIEKMKVS